MLYKGKVCFLGLGISNFKLLQYFLKNKILDYYFVSDSKEIKSEYKEYLMENGIPFEENGHTEEIRNCDSYIMSPGISPDSPIGREVIDSKKIYSTEMEISLSLLSRKKSGIVVGITGTNGKSTTTTMIGYALKKTKFKTFVGGNLGNPLIEALNDDYDFHIVEVSSFQLSWFKYRRKYFDLSILLNIEQDHLNYYSDLEEYEKAKLKIIDVTRNYCFVRDEVMSKFRQNIISKPREGILTFSNRPGQMFYYTNDEIVIHKLHLKTDYMKIKGIQNNENLLSSVVILGMLGMDYTDAMEKLTDYKTLNHRNQLVGEIDGIKFIDDSKATNSHAVITALINQNPKKTIIILGGVEKNENYDRLLNLLSFLKKIIVIGDSLSVLIEEFKVRNMEYIKVDSMKEAVVKAFDSADEGDTILLSPGGSSFDIYDNYKERGNDFQKNIESLKKLIGSAHES